jgi:heptosyltransferase I
VTISSPPQSLLVVRLGAMGDVIHTIPAVAALRTAFPEMRIGWIIEQRWSELLCAKAAPRSGPLNSARPLIDLVHVVDTKAWRKSLLSGGTRQEIVAVMREVREQHYQVAVDFQGALKSAVIAQLAGAKMVAGMNHPREWPARILYPRLIETTGSHVIEQYHSLAEAAAGKQLVHCGAKFPHDDQSEMTVTKLLTSGEPFVLITPGTGWGAKQWPPERYGEVARTFAQDGLTPIINSGPGEEELASVVEKTSGGTARLVSCSISELIALTRRAKLFIGGDTGPLHLAAALGVRVLAIFGPTDPARNGPYATRNIVLRNSKSRTSLSHTSESDPGLLNITTDQVIAAARCLLEASRG